MIPHVPALAQDAVLLLDVGNSSIVARYYAPDSQTVIQSWKLATESWSLLEDDPRITHVWIASVVPDLTAPIAERFSAPVSVVSAMDIPQLSIQLAFPEQVGVDRLLGALAAHRQFPNRPILIIDLGTALTACFVDAHGGYQGGCIFPGISVACKSLRDYTAKVPYIPLDQRPSGILGKRTDDAVRIGVYRGFLHLMNGWIADYKAQYKDLCVIGTGTGMRHFEDLIGTESSDHLALDALDLDLVMKGLECLATTAHQEV